MYAKHYLCIQETVLILKTAYSSAIKFTRLTPGNVFVQAEGMLRPMKTLVLIEHHVEEILLKK